MYPFEVLRPHYRRLWNAVLDRVPGLPATLTWPDDVHATWTDDEVVVKQACGWPLVTQLADIVRVVGAFEHDVDGAEDHRYRTAIVATSAGGPADFSASTAAYNSTDSLSGWVSLLAWSGRPGESLRACSIETGSHRASLESLRAGRAQFASIDAVTLEHVRRHEPELLDGLQVVGMGPLVPTLPVVVPAGVGDDLVHELRETFGSVVTDDALTTTCEALLITGFASLDLDDYQRALAHLSSA